MSAAVTAPRQITARSKSGTFGTGTRVFARNMSGTVVGNISEREYSSGLRAGSWNVLNAGVLVRWDDGTLTHIREPELYLQRVSNRP